MCVCVCVVGVLHKDIAKRGEAAEGREDRVECGDRAHPRVCRCLFVCSQVVRNRAGLRAVSPTADWRSRPHLPMVLWGDFKMKRKETFFHVVQKD